MYLLGRANPSPHLPFSVQIQSCLLCRFYLGNRMKIGSDSGEWGYHGWAFANGRKVNPLVVLPREGMDSRWGAAGGGGHHWAPGSPSMLGTQAHGPGMTGRRQRRAWGLLGLGLGVRKDPGAARRGRRGPARRPYLPIIVECCCTAASSSLSRMVHSPIAERPEAADTDWAAPGPSPGRPSRLGAKCPPIKESNKIV